MRIFLIGFISLFVPLSVSAQVTNKPGGDVPTTSVPATGCKLGNLIFKTTATRAHYQCGDDGNYHIMAGSTWGTVGGTLSSQTDLQNSLNLKAPLSSPTFSGKVRFADGTKTIPAADSAVGAGFHFTATAFGIDSGGNTSSIIGAGLATVSGGTFSWTASATDATAAADTTIARAAAKSINIGASGDATGTVNALAFVGVTVKITPVLVANLTTCNGGAEGTLSGVTDALTPVALSPVVGLGTTHVPVYCDGTSWIVE